ncbi:teichoic acid glycosylation protein [Enterococcus sp. JM4C]|uniref:GtrA family protein n=1 Tax=Candidatus Enterococcus huntleyi TaxID=1857217 RepID=UPI0013798191|nr:GtrA family protein [Enterococcus sp. JM4C]KAF1297247.1 teichoic acid glycosylation protein [Enterococcus sp. JM4C]
MNKIKTLVNNIEAKGYWEVLTYVFFGGLTTVVNFIVYFIFKDFLNLDMVISNTASWVAAVIFAFVTNKLWVFKSHSKDIKSWAFEFSQFVFYRLLSFGIDMGSMFILIKIIHIDDFVSKLITQIFIVIANYIFSKLFIFKKKEI